MLRFAASGEVLALIARAVEAERQCCRFLRFGIVVEPASGPMFLEVSGGPGTTGTFWTRCCARSVRL